MLAYRATRGIPRMINQVCDLALVYGYGVQAPRIGDGLLAAVIDDRGIGGISTVLQPNMEKILEEATDRFVSAETDITSMSSVSRPQLKGIPGSVSNPLLQTLPEVSYVRCETIAEASGMHPSFWQRSWQQLRSLLRTACGLPTA